MYPSTFAHLKTDYSPPTAIPAAAGTRRRSRRSLRTLLPALALRPVSPNSACGETR